MKKNKKIALTIAGSDSSGGAGIQADIKAFNILGVHGTSVITCITSQNSKKVDNIYKVPIEIIENQIDILYDDICPDIVKLGLLYDVETVNMISKKIDQYDMKILIDPVMISTSGNKLVKGNYVNTVKESLISKAYLVTPNILEAKEISNLNVKSVDDVKESCKIIYDLGSEYVLIKGGHLKEDNSIDVFYDGKRFTTFSLPFISGRKAHGSGCTLSALIAGSLALGKNISDSVLQSKQLVWNMINDGYFVGEGSDFLNSFTDAVLNYSPIFPTREHFDVWLDLKMYIDNLLSFLDNDFIPEVGMNIGYALSNAKIADDICAIKGRIVKTNDKPLLNGSLSFGSSKHIASIILTAMKFDPSLRCAMNIKYSEESVDLCKKVGLLIGLFDRNDEPENIKSSMEWGTFEVLKKCKLTPDIVYDIGGHGKEPMIRILGKNPKDVVDKLCLLAREK